jgi:hypothetical protein
MPALLQTTRFASISATLTPERPSSPLAFGMMRLGLLSFASRVWRPVDWRYFFVGE